MAIASRSPSSSPARWAMRSRSSEMCCSRAVNRSLNSLRWAASSPAMFRQFGADGALTTQDQPGQGRPYRDDGYQDTDQFHTHGHCSGSKRGSMITPTPGLTVPTPAQEGKPSVPRAVLWMPGHARHDVSLLHD